MGFPARGSRAGRWKEPTTDQRLTAGTPREETRFVDERRGPSMPVAVPPDLATTRRTTGMTTRILEPRDLEPSEVVRGVLTLAADREGDDRAVAGASELLQLGLGVANAAGGDLGRLAAET